MNATLTGAELRTRREALSLSRSKLGRELDVDQATIYAWETGRRSILHPGMLTLALERLGQKLKAARKPPP